MIREFDELICASRGRNGIISVAAAHDEVTLEGVVKARTDGIIKTAILTGHSNEIARILENLNESAEEYHIINAENDAECAKLAVAEVREGRANALMKGLIGTADIMRAVLNRENGLRTGNQISHIMMYKAPAYRKVITVTDAGVSAFPNCEQKAQILENAAKALIKLGYEEISAACVCGAEKVEEKIQATVDAKQISEMTDKWGKYNMSVFGPVGLDLALSEEACRHKGYNAEGCGNADILLVPDFQAGNLLSKAISLFGNAQNAGVVLGAAAPIILVSRSDPAYSKVCAIALGILLGNDN